MSVPEQERVIGSWRPAYSLYRWAWSGLDWLFPPSCGGCGARGTRWCGNCQENTRLIPSTICQICGDVQNNSVICHKCQTSPPEYSALRSWAVFEGPLRNALHRLKYKGDLALGEVLSRPLAGLLKDLNWKVDLVTAVPIGVARRAERGYNQATLLAHPLALSTGLAFQPNALSKTRETRTQVGLSASDRRKNVSGAFEAYPQHVMQKRVLVVDDVTTSGATMEACAEALLGAGARQVFGLTLARAPFTSARF
jgi:ComF family protein